MTIATLWLFISFVRSGYVPALGTTKDSDCTETRIYEFAISYIRVFNFVYTLLERAILQSIRSQHDGIAQAITIVRESVVPLFLHVTSSDACDNLRCVGIAGRARDVCSVPVALPVAVVAAQAEARAVAVETVDVS